MTLKGTSFIGFARSNSQVPCAKALNPADGNELEPDYFAATDQEVEQALKMAKAAFFEYSELSGEARARFLRAIADNLEASLPDLLVRMPQETGLPDGRVQGETARTCGQLRMFAELAEAGDWQDVRIEHADPGRKPLPKPDLRSMNVPLGPVGVFCPSNFPLAFSVAGGDTASALAVGCPVVVVAHHSHPGVAEIAAQAVVRAAQETGMPEGVFSLLYGGGRKVGLKVVRAPEISAIGFTGSRTGGEALMKEAANRPVPIPVYAEMSALNPLVMLPSALADEGAGETLAENYFGSLTLGVGQFCTNPGLVILPDQGGDKFLAKLAELVAGSSSGVMLNQGISKAYAEAVEKISKIDGVEALAVAAQNAEESGFRGHPAVFIVDSDTFAKHSKCLQEEAFGPAALLIKTPTEEMAAVVELLEGQLTATIHGSEEEINAHPQLLHALRSCSGRLIFNGFPTGVEVCSSMVHGGPYPATSDGRSSSVGTLAVHRFCRQAAWQDAPTGCLPAALRD